MVWWTHFGRHGEHHLMLFLLVEHAVNCVVATTGPSGLFWTKCVTVPIVRKWEAFLSHQSISWCPLYDMDQAQIRYDIDRARTPSRRFTISYRAALPYARISLAARPWIAGTYLSTYVNITYFHGKSSRARSQSGGQVVTKR